MCGVGRAGEGFRENGRTDGYDPEELQMETIEERGTTARRNALGPISGTSHILVVLLPILPFQKNSDVF